MHHKFKLSESPQETFNFGLVLAKELPKNSCVLLNGTLGAGKTQFIKGLCSFFNIDHNLVQSPTYSLHHEYEGDIIVHHFDLYRLSNTQEFLNRGFYDIIESTQPIFIEWPSMIDRNIFSNKICFDVNFKILEGDTREIHIIHE